MKVFSEKFQIPLALSTSMAMYKEQDWMAGGRLWSLDGGGTLILDKISKQNAGRL
jgi:hypothetical protein